MTAGLATGSARIAEVLVALGPKRAVPILRSFAPDEIEEIATAIAELGELDQDRSKTVLVAFAKEMVTSRRPKGDLDYATELLTQIFGADQAQAMAQRIDPRVSRPFGWMSGVSPTQIARGLRDEPPATIAVALVHLHPPEAARILRLLPDPKRSDVALRMGAMETLAPDVITMIDASLRDRLADTIDQPLHTVAGVEMLVEILNQSPPKMQKKIIEQIREKDTKLATRIQDGLFVFDDILQLDNRAVQEVLKNADTMDLALALKGSSAAINDLIFHNLSERAADSLRDEIEYLQSPKAADVKAAKSRIVATIRQLEEAGTIEVARPVADDEDEDE